MAALFDCTAAKTLKRMCDPDFAELFPKWKQLPRMAKATLPRFIILMLLLRLATDGHCGTKL